MIDHLHLDLSYNWQAALAFFVLMVALVRLGYFLAFKVPALQRMKQYEAADSYYSMALTLDKGNAMSLVYRGESMIMAGHVDDGLKIIGEGVTAAEGNVEMTELLDRGKLLLKQFSR